MSEDEAPGWEAIHRALAPIYGEGDPPFHYGTLLSARLGGPDPIDGISAYRSSEYRDHWHFITFGFSELYGTPSAGDAKSIQFERGDRFAFGQNNNAITVTLTSAQMRELVATLKPVRGEYDVAGMRVTVEPSHIRDQSGKIVETVG